jgi:hypothetical protein
VDQFAVLADVTDLPARPGHWSLDAWVMCQPNRAFQYIAMQPTGRGAWLALRRPLFVAFMLACGISLMTTGVLTLRLLISVMAYWTFVPAIEVLALAVVLWRTQREGAFAAAIDRFFMGHGPWTLYLIAFAGSLAVVPPNIGWTLITTVWLWMLAVVLCWSFYVDFCFFRWITGARHPVALRRVLIHRLMTWTGIFVIFAVPNLSPSALSSELSEAIAEILRR